MKGNVRMVNAEWKGEEKPESHQQHVEVGSQQSRNMIAEKKI